MRARRIIPWVLYAVCTLAVLEGLGYAGYKALDLQRQRREAEATRLALWRMDSALTAVLAAESARPYFHYRAFHPAERAYNAMLGPVRPGEVLVPSPLLTRVPPFVRLHFEIDAEGRVTSPQAPEGNLRDLAEAEYVAADDVIAAESLRLMLAGLLAQRDTPPALDDSPVGFVGGRRAGADADQWARQEAAAAAQLGPSQRERLDFSDLDLSHESAKENPGARSRVALMEPVPTARDRGLPERLQVVPRPEVTQGPLSAAWLAPGELVLHREVRVGEDVLQQGVWLDWPALHAWLVAQVADLAPGARLRAGAGEDRSLAVIPAVLEAQPVGTIGDELASPLGVVLVLTWLAALLAVGAIGIVLRLATSLAERRGRFVSAVTHELRTPMTSVRLYADLLAGEPALDEPRRRRYVGTLREESARLARIIENVLAYARLGRANGTEDDRPATVGGVVGAALAEQAGNLERAGLRAVVDVRDADATRPLDADGQAAARIVGNLVENACKYAKPSREPVVHIVARCEQGHARFTVRDTGPGVPRKDQRRIFEAFHRAPRDELREHGLGLGLALARGLAKQMGGTLTLDTPDTEGAGASFTLTLPLLSDRRPGPR